MGVERACEILYLLIAQNFPDPELFCVNLASFTNSVSPLPSLGYPLSASLSLCCQAEMQVLGQHTPPKKSQKQYHNSIDLSYSFAKMFSELFGAKLPELQSGSETSHSTENFRGINFPKCVISISTRKFLGINSYFNWEMSTGQFSGNPLCVLFGVSLPLRSLCRQVVLTGALAGRLSGQTGLVWSDPRLLGRCLAC